MEKKTTAKRRRDAGGSAAVRERIFQRVCQGWPHDEIARDEGISVMRMRRILQAALKERQVLDEASYARAQIDRLAPLMKAALDAVDRGNVKAAATLLKVMDRLDRYRAALQTRHG